MASTSESGHSKNVANLKTLTTKCAGFGAKYNPSNPKQSLAAMNTLHVAAQKALDECRTASTENDNATNNREIEFEPLKSFCTRLLNSFIACDPPEQMIDDARAFNKVIQGTSRKKPKPAEGEPEKPGRSTSRQSYDIQAENFADFIETIISFAGFNPNEPEFKPAALTAKVTSLRDKNIIAQTAGSKLANKVIARQEVLYKGTNSVYAVATSCKKYVKAVFGATSPQYKQVSGLKFSKS